MIQSRTHGSSAGSRLALISLPILAGCVSTTQAQEALLNAVQGDQSYQNRRQQAIESPMPMHAGPVGFSVAANLGLAYDDNVLISSENQQDDFIVTPGATVGIYYPITERTRINLGVGLGYQIYTQGTRQDRFTLAPNSELAFDFEVGKALVTTFDRFTYSQDLLQQGEVASNGNYGGLDNALGFRISWVPEPVLVEGGYTWDMFASDNQTYRGLDRNSHQLFFRMGQVIAQRSRWGVELTGSKTFYDTGVRNDFSSLSAGPYLELQATEALFLNARAGWSWTLFDHNGQQAAPADVSVPYLNLNVRHQLTAHFSHTLSAVREVRVSTESQYIESLVFSYGFNWQVTDLITPAVSVFYEKSREPSVPMTEDYDRVGLNFGLPFRLTDHLTLALGYIYTIRDSNISGRDYTDNLASMNLSYQF